MEASTGELKKGITKWPEEPKDQLPVRIHALWDDIKTEDLSEGQEASLFDLTTRIILRADEDPTRHMANLLIPINTDKPYSLDEWTISNSAAFIRGYLKRDYIFHILKTKDQNKEKSREDIE